MTGGTVGRRGFAFLTALAIANCLAAAGEEREPVRAQRPQKRADDRLPLTHEQRERLDASVDRGLEFLAAHQNSDGSFETVPMARPAVTSLCVIAFLSRGHRPGQGPYGSRIERAIDYVLSLQDSDSGVIMSPPDGARGWDRAGNYNHAISGMMLADVFPFLGRSQYLRDRTREGAGAGVGAANDDRVRKDRVEKAVRRALAYARREQQKPKSVFGEQGGWRYANVNMHNDSDLSVSAWMIMFLHSARKSGFVVKDLWMKGGLKFVHHTYNKRQHVFAYVISEGNPRCTRATVGAGILCLMLGGEPVGQSVRDAADWIHQQSFEPYNVSQLPQDRYHYSAFYCSQAMGLLGGSDFASFYPDLLRVLSDHQQSDGSWDAESAAGDAVFGNIYTTALAVLALSPPYQMLKTYQR